MRLLLVSRVPIFTRRVRTHLECVFRPVRRKSSKVERCKLSLIVIHHIQIRGTVRCGAAARREPSGAIGRFATRTLMFTPPVGPAAVHTSTQNPNKEGLCVRSSLGASPAWCVTPA